jgi:hypothetical protein
MEQQTAVKIVLKTIEEIRAMSRHSTNIVIGNFNNKKRLNINDSTAFRISKGITAILDELIKENEGSHLEVDAIIIYDEEINEEKLLEKIETIKKQLLIILELNRKENYNGVTKSYISATCQNMLYDLLFIIDPIK